MNGAFRIVSLSISYLIKFHCYCDQYQMWSNSCQRNRLNRRRNHGTEVSDKVIKHTTTTWQPWRRRLCSWSGQRMRCRPRSPAAQHLAVGVHCRRLSCACPTSHQSSRYRLTSPVRRGNHGDKEGLFKFTTMTATVMTLLRRWWRIGY